MTKALDPHTSEPPLVPEYECTRLYSRVSDIEGGVTTALDPLVSEPPRKRGCRNCTMVGQVHDNQFRSSYRQGLPVVPAEKCRPLPYLLQRFSKLHYSITKMMLKSKDTLSDSCRRDGSNAAAIFGTATAFPAEYCRYTGLVHAGTTEDPPL